MFKQILVAVDESDQSTAALDLAIELGKTLGSALTLVHVLDPGKVSTPADVTAVSTVEIEVEDLEDAGKSILESAVARAKGAGLEVTSMMRDGIPAPTIIDSATRSNCDLIVLGTHGRHGVAHFFLGSTAESVARDSKVPVLIKRS
jgi:nucleotide-binding universal stress UspA family protein